MHTKRQAFYLLFFLGCSLLMAKHRAAEATPSPSTTTSILLLTVDNIQAAAGAIWVGVYQSEEDFLDREKARLLSAKVSKSGALTLPIEELLCGQEYALAVFHDINGNGELDRNFLGIPTEPWAFSGRLRSRFRLPYFDEVKFSLQGDTAAKRLSLRKW